MIALACDHAGYDLKADVIAVLRELNLPYQDFGTQSRESVDYPIYGLRAAKAVASGQCERGIILCGTGVGISMAASKVKGIRCVVCSESYTAALSRRHNDANMLALGARVVGSGLAQEIVRLWLTTPFEGERHGRRVQQLAQIEEGKALE